MTKTLIILGLVFLAAWCSLALATVKILSTGKVRRSYAMGLAPWGMKWIVKCIYERHPEFDQN